MYVSAEADGCVLVVNPNKTKVDATQKAVEKLKSIQANILGVVLNKKEK
jgi:Mrp family chromosome partitioning ATPase